MNDISLTSTGGWIAVGVVDAGEFGDVTLNSAAGVSDTANTVTADVLTVRAAGAVTLTNVETADGAIHVTAAGDMTVLQVASLTDSGANDVTLHAAAGAMSLNLVNAGTFNDVTLQAAGAVLSFSVDTQFVYGGTISITAGAGIGAADAVLWVDTGNGRLDADV